jgi:hypothetical protein
VPHGDLRPSSPFLQQPTLLAGDRSLANVVAHEIAHSWTGVRVIGAGAGNAAFRQVHLAAGRLSGRHSQPSLLPDAALAPPLVDSQALDSYSNGSPFPSRPPPFLPGNLVTNATWEHFWLNEGFTVFLERKILGRLYGEQVRCRVGQRPATCVMSLCLPACVHQQQRYSQGRSWGWVWVVSDAVWRPGAPLPARRCTSCRPRWAGWSCKMR